MPCLQKLLAGLMLFSPAAHALATPEQALEGKIRGFTGSADVTELTGDCLTATFCYCKRPPHIEDVTGMAHYYQFEYYNVHLNTTFILTSKCPDIGTGGDTNCVPTSAGEDLLAGDTIEEICKSWEGYGTTHHRWGKLTDKFCYKPHPKDGDDYMSFNGQERDLSKWGGQGPRFQSKEKSEEVCEDLCRTTMDAGLLRDDTLPPSHQVVWANIDDMCEGCA